MMNMVVMIVVITFFCSVVDEKSEVRDSKPLIDYRPNEAILVIEKILDILFQKDEEQVSYLRKRDDQQRTTALVAAAKFHDFFGVATQDARAVPRAAVWFFNLLKYFLSKGVRFV